MDDSNGYRTGDPRPSNFPEPAPRVAASHDPAVHMASNEALAWLTAHPGESLHSTDGHEIGWRPRREQFRIENDLSYAADYVGQADAWTFLLGHNVLRPDCVPTIPPDDAPVASDAIRPTYYRLRCGVEVIEITRHETSNVGQALQYILRRRHKHPEKELEELRKAVWFLNDEIERLRAEESKR